MIFANHFETAPFCIYIYRYIACYYLEDLSETVTAAQGTNGISNYRPTAKFPPIMSDPRAQKDASRGYN